MPSSIRSSLELCPPSPTDPVAPPLARAPCSMVRATLDSYLLYFNDFTWRKFMRMQNVRTKKGRAKRRQQVWEREGKRRQTEKVRERGREQSGSSAHNWRCNIRNALRSSRRIAYTHCKKCHTVCVPCCLFPLSLYCECCLYCVCVCAVCMKRPKTAFVCQATRSWLLGAQQRAAGSGAQFALATHYSSMRDTHTHSYTQSGTRTHTRLHVARERETLIASLVVGLVCVLWCCVCVRVCVEVSFCLCVCVCVAVWLLCVLHVAALWRLK